MTKKVQNMKTEFGKEIEILRKAHAEMNRELKKFPLKNSWKAN